MGQIYCFPFNKGIMCFLENVRATVIICLLCYRLCNVQRKTKGKVAWTAFHKVIKHNPNLRAFAPAVLLSETLFQKSLWLTSSLHPGLGSDTPSQGGLLWPSNCQQLPPFLPNPIPLWFIFLLYTCHHLTYHAPSLFILFIVSLPSLECNSIRAEISVYLLLD